MKIRPFQSTDKLDVINLWHECGLTVLHNNPHRDIERKLRVDPDLFLVGHIGSSLVATVMGGYEGHRGWINYLAVKPAAQRKGYGRSIMRALETRLEQKGCPKINLQIRSSNEAIIAFYDALGYSRDDVIGMGKRLQHES